MGQRRIPLDQLPPGVGGHLGLSSEQVTAQRLSCGDNDIVPHTTSGWVGVARDTARDPMLWFLVCSAGLFALLGQFTESLVLLLAMVPLLGMDAYLHRRTQASSASLASRLALSARVLRDGQWQDLASRELVPGDLVEVRPGEYFPADGLLIAGEGLQADESTLTGESLPVVKRAIAPSTPPPAAAPDDGWGTAGTRLLTGTAGLRVVFTGGHTRYGEIVRTAAEGSHGTTPLQKAIGGLVGVLLAAALSLCVVLASVRLWQGYGWIDAALSAVTLAVAAVPEEFPVVYTFFLGMGVFRLARKNALVRRAVAVENIGRTTCILSDKTGTLTAGALVLSHTVPAPPLDDRALLQMATLAARPDSGDPLDQALHAAGSALPSAAGAAPPARSRAIDFPFTEVRRRETAVWSDTGRRLTAYTKGAPETVLSLCELTEQERSRWLGLVDEHARSGRKLIACAWKDLVPGQPVEREPDHGFTIAGLLAFEDPVRDGVRDAIADCTAAGMRVVMVTGDHLATATAIARAIGLGGDRPRAVALDTADDPAALFRQHKALDVAARATPAQKLALVQVMQAAGEFVAVTGDGVNDVPALRQADIGVAMGARGTQSAREVAPVVLLDDNFKTIVDAVAEGRQLFQNLRWAFSYLLLVHIPLVVGAAAIPLMGLPLLFLPIHIVWLELVIHPTAMLAFQDLPSRTTLAQAPRPRTARFFTPRAWVAIGLVGAWVVVVMIGSYLQALGAERDVEHARAMALALLLTASVGITAGLTRWRGAASRWLGMATVASLALAIQEPGLGRVLHLRPLHAGDWLLVVLAGVVTAWLVRALLAGDPPAASPRTSGTPT